MMPAITWSGDRLGDHQDMGWSVMGSLQDRLSRQAAAVRSQLPSAEPEFRVNHMVAGTCEPDLMSQLGSSIAPIPIFLTFIFAYPDSEAIQTLDARGGVFDNRTGDNWDLFFPGYGMATGASSIIEPEEPVGKRFLKDWFFSEQEFHALRAHIEDCSDNAWRFSGEIDLVTVNAWVAFGCEPSIDWESTQSGSLTDETMTISQVVEAVSSEVEQGLEDQYFNIGSVLQQPDLESVVIQYREIVYSIIGGIIANTVFSL